MSLLVELETDSQYSVSNLEREKPLDLELLELIEACEKKYEAQMAKADIGRGKVELLAFRGERGTAPTNTIGEYYSEEGTFLKTEIESHLHDRVSDGVIRFTRYASGKEELVKRYYKHGRWEDDIVTDPQEVERLEAKLVADLRESLEHDPVIVKERIQQLGHRALVA